MRFIVPTVAEVRLTIMRGAAYWRAPGRECADDVFPPETVMRRWLDLMLPSPEATTWFAPRLFWVEAIGAIVGTGSFKTAPDDPLGVEIGYGIAAQHRGRGHATAAVRHLVAEAFARSDTPHVFASVNPANLASLRVLAKCGFTREGEALDPDDGLVWRFVLPRTGTDH